jgi:hypothetical protein
VASEMKGKKAADIPIQLAKPLAGHDMEGPQDRRGRRVPAPCRKSCRGTRESIDGEWLWTAGRGSCTTSQRNTGRVVRSWVW